MEEQLAGRSWFGVRGWVGGIMSREREQVGGGVDVVSVRSLVKTYGDRTVLGGVDLGIESGIVFGLLGPNGAGKSNLLETVAGLRRPPSGSVPGFGFDPRA